MNIFRYLGPSPRLFLALLTTGFAAGSARAAEAVFVDADDPAVAEIRATGEAAAMSLMQRLSSELITAMRAGGPANAVEVCHTRAMPLTAQIDPSLPTVTAVKRTSLKLRNPLNAPDAAEQAALDFVAALIADGKAPPPALVQRLDSTENGEAEWRVYKTITVASNCLACHGSSDAQTATLRDKLERLYPQDASTEYQNGDWRGLFRISVQPALNHSTSL